MVMLLMVIEGLLNFGMWKVINFTYKPDSRLDWVLILYRFLM